MKKNHLFLEGVQNKGLIGHNSGKRGVDQTLCIGENTESTEVLIQTLKEEILDAGSSCAFGLSTNKPLKEMLRDADNKMYKAMIKADVLASGGNLHTRG